MRWYSSNSQCFHGNVLAVSINQFLQWINIFFICYPVHMLLYQFHFNLDWDATPPHSLSSPIIHTDIASFFFIAHAQYQFIPLVKRTVYTEKSNGYTLAVFSFTFMVLKGICYPVLFCLRHMRWQQDIGTNVCVFLYFSFLNEILNYILSF